MVQRKNYCRQKNHKSICIRRFECIISHYCQLSSNCELANRGGVVDTSLEAKDTKKNPRPRPRTAFSRTDTLEAKDKNARGQGQRPRTQAQVLSKKKRSSQKFFRRSPKKKGLHKNFSGDLQKKKVFTKIFQAIPRKRRFPKNFSGAPQNLTIQKIVMSSSRGQVNFRGLEASRPRPRTWPSRPRPRTSKCVLEAKDVLEDSTSASETPSNIEVILLQYFEIFRSTTC